MNLAAGLANLVGKPTDFGQSDKFGGCGFWIVATRNISQQSFQSPRLQRQADMTDAQWPHDRT